jgi:FkbM family methyltransferase
MSVRKALKKKLIPCIEVVSNVVSRSKVLQKGLRQVSFTGKGSIVRGLSGLPQNIESKCSGIKYSLQLNDILQREIYFNEFDRKQLPKFLSLMPQEGICFDIGANVGFYTLHMAKKLGEKGKVFSFEPHPTIFKQLTANCSLNSFGKNVQKFSYAVAEAEDRKKFFLPHDQCSGSGSFNLYAALSGSFVEVHCVALDDFVSKNRINEIAFMKIDVEGAEFEVIKGAHRLMTEKRIKKIYVEYNGDLQLQKDHNFSDFLNLFASYNYFPDTYNADMLRKLANKMVNPRDVVTDFVFIPAV